MKIVLQKPSYSEQTITSSNPKDIFNNTNWDDLLAEMNKLKSNGKDNCPPGIYFYKNKKSLGFSTEDGKYFTLSPVSVNPLNKDSYSRDEIIRAIDKFAIYTSKSSKKNLSKGSILKEVLTVVLVLFYLLLSIFLSFAQKTRFISGILFILIGIVWGVVAIKTGDKYDSSFKFGKFTPTILSVAFGIILIFNSF